VADGHGYPKGVMVGELDAMLSIVMAKSARDMVILQVCGELTRGNAPRLDAAVDEQLVAGPRAIIVDLSEVRMLGPEGLSVLVRLAVRAGEADLGLCLVEGERCLVVRRLEEAGLAERFEVYVTVDDAVASLRPS